MATIIIGTDSDDIINKESSIVSFQINGFLGDDEIVTGSGNDQLNGDEGNDFLFSGAGKDTLTGGVGADYLAGGVGDDVYFVDEDDTVVEEFNQGVDLVKSSADYYLSDDLENLELTGLALIGVGNSLNNKITGNNEANLLSGMDGKDTLIGGAGDDIYEVNLIQAGSTPATIVVTYADTVIETIANGNDTIKVFGNLVGVADLEFTPISVNFELIANTENLDISNLTAEDNVALHANLVGNSVANRLIGNDGANALDGGIAVLGSNIQDTLVGGAGDDTYVVDIVQDNSNVIIQDSVIEESDNGSDTLMLRGQLVLNSNISFGLVANTENINASLTGTTKLNLQGNEANNLLIGNAANNELNGGLGADTLDGGVGADILYGGEGDDTYILNDALDTVIENGVSEFDTIQTSLLTFDLSSINGTNIENLVYIGTGSFSGVGSILDNYITGGDGNDTLDGGGGDDRLYGGKGNDILYGGAGFDSLLGESGDDTYVIDQDDIVFENEDDGVDTIQAIFDYTLDENIENLVLLGNAVLGVGNALDNLIEGNAEVNRLVGGEGTDTLIGGAGDDLYEVELSESGNAISNYKVSFDDQIIEALNEGNDTVSVSGNINGVEEVDNLVVTINATLSANVENLDLSNVTASSDVFLKLNLFGNEYANRLTGNSSSNIIDGGTGLGLAAIDTLIGGDGDDIYIVDMINVSGSLIVQDVIEDSEGNDTLALRAPLTLSSSLDIQLIDGIENIDASKTATTKLNLVGNDSANLLTGNSANNNITGYEGDDTLIGGVGKDTLVGGDGNDYYVLDAGDVVIEDGLVDSTNDSVVVDFSFNLLTTNLDSIENLILTGKAAINGFGNAIANHIYGNSAANLLSGGDSNDILSGGSGNDTLDGGAGDDIMYGGLGNDVYMVDSLEDTVFEDGAVEINGEFIDKDLDKIISTISYSLNGVSNIEQLTLAGLNSINGTGNELNNLITGNVANNLLQGAEGIDTLKGGKGDDVYVVALAQIGEDDATAKIKLEDTIIENASEGSDSLILTGDLSNVGAYTQLILGANLEKVDASATGTTLLNITGNTLNNYLIGNDAGNILSGGAGNDTIEAGDGDKLIGGAGNDTYILSNNSYQLVEATGGGIDTLVAEMDFDLSLNFENLQFIGGSDINGTGNSVANYLIGNDGNNRLIGLLGNDTLVGGLGSDSLIGGLGNDVYIVEDSTDSIVEDTAAGTDTIQSYISLNLADYNNIEQLTLLGNSAINATGNDVANLLIGNSAANILHGGLGIDKLQGGNGDDIYEVNLMQSSTNTLTATTLLEDMVTEGLNQGNDTIVLNGDFSSLVKTSTLTLVANVENLNAEATGMTKLNLMGNNANNLLIGNDAANNINGSLGNDTLSGDAGADTLLGGIGNDVLSGGVDADRLEGGVGNDTLNGGDGSDIFVFNSILINNRDIANDFVSSEDRIELDRSFFTKLAIGNLNENNFHQGPLAVDADDFILYDSNTGNLYYDSDGNGSAIAINFAVIGGGISIAANDFIVVN